jgi:16S rRNA (guanine966-N2)-methyltransferase
VSKPRSARGLRVIAGSARGRRLVAPTGDQVRPTKDIARESMFSALDARGVLEGAIVLDLYAGTGALAIEALSRGAAAAVLVERDRAALEAIRANLLVLPSSSVDPSTNPSANLSTNPSTRPRVDVVARDVGRFLAAGPPPDAPFDLVFVDPPYDTADEDVTAVLASLMAPGWLAPGAIVSVERPVRHPVVVPPGLSTGWERTFGDTLLSFVYP